MAAATMTRNWSDQFRSSFQEIEVNPLEEGATALMYACQQENLEQLQTILKKKVSSINTIFYILLLVPSVPEEMWRRTHRNFFGPKI